jgi:hypothetical protein
MYSFEWGLNAFSIGAVFSDASAIVLSFERAQGKLPGAVRLISGKVDIGLYESIHLYTFICTGCTVYPRSGAGSVARAMDGGSGYVQDVRYTREAGQALSREPWMAVAAMYRMYGIPEM